MKYLIPLEIGKGNFPSQEQLMKFCLINEYGEIVKACISGDIALLEKTLTLKEENFIKSGIFVTIEPIK